MKEAIDFQNEFDELWDNGTQDDLIELLNTIKQQLPRYKVFENGNGNEKV